MDVSVELSSYIDSVESYAKSVSNLLESLVRDVDDLSERLTLLESRVVEILEHWDTERQTFA